MKLMVCGSRTITNDAWVMNQIDSVVQEIGKDNLVIIEGDARGVDTIAGAWAIKNNISIEHYPADWKTYGRAAGFIRNKQMVEACDFCLILWDGISKGTKNDIDLCEKLSKPKRVVLYQEN